MTSKLLSRPFLSSDIQSIDRIFHLTNLQVPSLENLVYNRVFESHHEVVAYGALKLFAELHLTLDPTLSPYLKAKIIDLGVREGIENSNGLERLYAIVDDEKEIEILKKHHDFKLINGKLLVKEID